MIWKFDERKELTWSSVSFCNSCFRNFLFASFASFKRSSISLTVESLRIFNIGLRVALVRLFIAPCGFLRNSITWKSQETYSTSLLSFWRWIRRIDAFIIVSSSRRYKYIFSRITRIRNKKVKEYVKHQLKSLLQTSVEKRCEYKCKSTSVIFQWRDLHCKDNEKVFL